MSLSFYMDEHVHRSITLGLRLRSIDVLTIQEDQRAGTSDPDVLDRATELGRLLFTQDDDFLVEAYHRQQQDIKFTGIIYAHQLSVSIGTCVQNLEIIAELGRFEEFDSRVHYLPI